MTVEDFDFSASEVADKLVESVEYMRKHGWTQDKFMATTGEVCAMGAMRRVVKLDTDQIDSEQYTDAEWVATEYRRREYLYHAMKEALRNCLWARFGNRNIAAWNDSPTQDAETVQTVMAECAETTREAAS